MTTTHREPRTARGEATRKRLLEAAEALFGRKGYHGTAVGDITRRAGVGQGTFYLYFESKEQVFRELIGELSHGLRSALHMAVAGTTDRLEAEEAGLRAFLAFAAEHRDLYRIVFESQSIDPELFRWYYERIAVGYARALGEAMEREEVRRLDAETVAYALMGAAHFLGMRWVVWENEEVPERALETMRGFVRGGLSPRGS